MGKLTLSGLLNAIDGASSSEERIIFMTTNYIDRLDAALIRPGRVDIKKYIGYASDDQICRAFDRFFPKPGAATDISEEAKDFLKVIKTYKEGLTARGHCVNLSMADIQSYLLLHKDRPQAAILNVSSWIKNNIAEKDIEEKVKPNVN